MPRSPLTVVLLVVAGHSAAVAPAGATPPAEPAAMTQTETHALEADWNAWHAERIERLSAEDGWLTLVGLDFLDEGKTTIGAGEKADLRYEGLGVDLAGTFTKSGDTVRFVAAPGAAMTMNGMPVDSVTLTEDQGPESYLRSGTVSVALVRRNDALALRVRDNASPVRLHFKGVERYAFDPALRVTARIERHEKGETMAVTNVLGYTADAPRDATLVFDLDGQERRLDAQGTFDSLFVVFGDTTNGAETHGGGRFLYVKIDEGDTAIVDFNRAYNPPCAFTAYSTCELPTANNRLPIPIRAGEKAVKSSEQ